MFAERKGQGTLEYLIILGVVLAIAIFAGVYIMNSSPTQQLNEQASKLYWAGMTPLSISQYSITSSGAQIVLQNSLSETITVTDFNLGNASINDFNSEGPLSVTISPGGKQTVSGTGVKCIPGQQFSYAVKIVYSTESLTDVPEAGTKSLVGLCSG